MEMALALGKRESTEVGMERGLLQNGSLICARVTVKYG